eukprot:611166-Rhodomonas_salina.1
MKPKRNDVWMLAWIFEVLSVVWARAASTRAMEGRHGRRACAQRSPSASLRASSLRVAKCRRETTRVEDVRGRADQRNTRTCLVDRMIPVKTLM